LFRGILHFLCTLLLPYGLLYLIKAAGNSNYVACIANSIYISTNIICYGSSALYHVGRWSVQVEILIQKLDHCGVAILSTGTMVPLCMLMLPYPLGILFMMASISCCLWTCYNIFELKPSVGRQVSVPACILPFLPWCYYHMNSFEFSCIIFVIISKAIGVAIFVNQKPDPIPHIFGYHEIFHFFVVIAGIFVYVCNLSMTLRSSGKDPLDFSTLVNLLSLYINSLSFRSD